MKYNDFKIKMRELIENNIELWKQTHIMFIPLMDKIIRETPTGEETRVRYGINEVWKEFSYKENKILFFIDKYLNNLSQGLELYDNIPNKKNITIPTNDIIEQAIYYFDSFITAFYTLIEAPQKDVLCKYLDNKKINDFFPTRNEIGLYWQIYMLRNRIIHFTNGKYSNSRKECIRYIDFTSNIKVININNNEEIKITCTLIDINKCKPAQLAIKKAIRDREINPFDILFPNESAKGYGKKKPFLSYIDNDIFFDYASSGVELIENIHKILNKINKLFLDQLLSEDKNSKDTLNKKTEIIFNEHKLSYSIYDVFYKTNIENK